jgi:hypothetical protein
MKHLTGILLLVSFLAIFGLGLLAANCSPGNFTVDKSGLRLDDPRIDAQAAAVEQQSRDAAAQAAIERQAQQAKAWQATVEAEATEAARSALIWRNRLYAFSLGLGAVVLVVGVAFAAVAWANKKANSVYPNAAGQYPVVIMRGFGWAALHDPNRGLGPTALYRTPTLVDQFASVLIALQEKRAPQLPAAAADFPPTADMATMAQIASQAQAGQVATAQNRWPRLPPIAARMTFTDRNSQEQIPVSFTPGICQPRLRIINEPERVEQFVKLLEAEGS